MPDFRVANIVRDSRILELAREEAEAWLAKDPDLTAPASRRVRAILEDRWAGRLRVSAGGIERALSGAAGVKGWEKRDNGEIEHASFCFPFSPFSHSTE